MVSEVEPLTHSILLRSSTPRSLRLEEVMVSEVEPLTHSILLRSSTPRSLRLEEVMVSEVEPLTKRKKPNTILMFKSGKEIFAGKSFPS